MTLPLLRRLAPLAVLVALVASACSTLVDDPAASVGDTEISIDAVEEELEIIQGNEAYRSALEQSYGAQLAGAGKGTFDSAFVAQLLSLRIYYELLEQELSARGVEVRGEDVRLAREAIEAQIGGQLGEEALEGFPERYRDELALQQALIEAATRVVAEEGLTVEEYFEENPEEFAEACVSHILVSTEERTEAEARAMAEELLARLRAGADFAALARAESDDPGSAEAGGDLGCGGRGRFVTAFEDAVFSQPVGQVGEPVQTSFGFHLILVRSRTEPELEDVRAEVEQRLEAQREQALSDFLVEVTCDEGTDVDVNPRYGRWDRTACEEGLGFPRVVPPEGPTTTDAPLPAEG